MVKQRRLIEDVDSPSPSDTFEVDGRDAIEPPRSVVGSFVIMTVCFALNHATATACIPLASGKFGKHLGSLSLGTMYLFYTLSAMLCSAAIVQELGHRRALALGCGGYTVYAASYLLGRISSESMQFGIVTLGSACGGVSAGFLWTAQGGFFANCAKWEAKLSGKSLTETTSSLSGFFATVYLALELAIKVLSSLIQVWVCGDKWQGDLLVGKCPDPNRKAGGEVGVFGVFTGVAVLSTLGMLFVEEVPTPVDDSEGSDGRRVPWTKKAAVALRLLCRDVKMPCMMFFNFAFGFSSAFVNTHVTGTVIAERLGDDKVGYFVSVIPLVATAASTPLGELSRRTGSNTSAMVAGGLCFAAFSTSFLLLPRASLERYEVLVPLFVVYGVGRATWEGPLKAVFATMFKRCPEAAFANLIIQLGTASTVAFFMGASGVSHTVLLWFAEIFSLLAILLYLVADRIHRSELTFDTTAEPRNPSTPLFLP